MSEDAHDSNNLPFRWHGPEPTARRRSDSLNTNRRADPTADFTPEELEELAELRRFHGIGDNIEQIREALGYRKPSSPLEGDSNFEFDNNVMGDVARRFYEKEAEMALEASRVLYESMIDQPSVGDALRAHGKGITVSVLPAVNEAVAVQCR